MRPPDSTPPADQRLGAQIARLDEILQVIELYESSRAEGVPALTLARRELDGVRDEIERISAAISREA
jgi:hypothetical protein